MNDYFQYRLIFGIFSIGNGLFLCSKNPYGASTSLIKEKPL